MRNIPHEPSETKPESFVVLIRRVLSPACSSNLISSVSPTPKPPHPPTLLPPTFSLALYPLHLSALKISERKTQEGECEWGRGREREARLKEVLEMRKPLLGVSLDWRGDRELGSRNIISAKVWITQQRWNKRWHFFTKHDLRFSFRKGDSTLWTTVMGCK